MAINNTAVFPKSVWFVRQFVQCVANLFRSLLTKVVTTKSHEVTVIPSMMMFTLRHTTIKCIEIQQKLRRCSGYQDMLPCKRSGIRRGHCCAKLSDGIILGRDIHNFFISHHLLFRQMMHNFHLPTTTFSCPRYLE